MAGFDVIVTGAGDGSDESWDAFYAAFAKAYGTTPEKTKAWLKSRGMAAYRYDDPKMAEKGKAFVEKIGGKAEIRTVEAPTPPAIQEGDAGAASARQAASAVTISCPSCGYGVSGGANFCPACGAPVGAGRVPPPPPVPGTAAYAPGGPVSPAMAPSGTVKPYHMQEPGHGMFDQAVPLANHVKRHDLGSIFDSLFDIFKRIVGQLLVFQLVPLAPLLIFGIIFIALALTVGIAASEGNLEQGIFQIIMFLGVFIPVMLYAQSIAAAASVTAISEACHGGTPGISETLVGNGWLLPMKLLLTQALGSAVVFLILVPPSFIATVLAEQHWLMVVPVVIVTAPIVLYVISLFLFLPQAVVLEGLWGFEGMSRSIELGKDHYMRNVGIMILLFVAGSAGVLIASVILSFVPILGSIAAIAIELLFGPALLAALTLLYFDMRVRKERYKPQTEEEKVAPDFTPPSSEWSPPGLDDSGTEEPSPGRTL